MKAGDLYDVACHARNELIHSDIVNAEVALIKSKCFDESRKGKFEIAVFDISNEAVERLVKSGFQISSSIPEFYFWKLKFRTKYYVNWVCGGLISEQD